MFVFESSEKLTMEEFVSRIAEIGSNLPSNVESEELVCEHKKRGRAHCFCGLCRECYDVFIDISEGGGIIEQPSFQNAKGQKIKHKQESMMSESSLSDVNDNDIKVYTSILRGRRNTRR